jgi:hypothetical protein
MYDRGEENWVNGCCSRSSFNDAQYRDYSAGDRLIYESGGVSWMRISRWTDVLGVNMPKRHFVRHKSRLGLNPGRRGGKPTTNCLSYGTALTKMSNSCKMFSVGSQQGASSCCGWRRRLPGTECTDKAVADSRQAVVLRVGVVWVFDHSSLCRSIVLRNGTQSLVLAGFLSMGMNFRFTKRVDMSWLARWLSGSHLYGVNYLINRRKDADMNRTLWRGHRRIQKAWSKTGNDVWMSPKRYDDQNEIRYAAGICARQFDHADVVWDTFAVDASSVHRVSWLVAEFSPQRL